MAKGFEGNVVEPNYSASGGPGIPRGSSIFTGVDALVSGFASTVGSRGSNSQSGNKSPGLDVYARGVSAIQSGNQLPGDLEKMLGDYARLTRASEKNSGSRLPAEAKLNEFTNYVMAKYPDEAEEIFSFVHAKGFHPSAYKDFYEMNEATKASVARREKAKDTFYALGVESGMGGASATESDYVDIGYQISSANFKLENHKNELDIIDQLGRTNREIAEQRLPVLQQEAANAVMFNLNAAVGYPIRDFIKLGETAVSGQVEEGSLREFEDTGRALLLQLDQAEVEANQYLAGYAKTFTIEGANGTEISYSVPLDKNVSQQMTNYFANQRRMLTSTMEAPMEQRGERLKAFEELRKQNLQDTAGALMGAIDLVGASTALNLINYPGDFGLTPADVAPYLEDLKNSIINMAKVDPSVDPSKYIEEIDTAMKLGRNNSKVLQQDMNVAVNSLKSIGKAARMGTMDSGDEKTFSKSSAMFISAVNNSQSIQPDVARKAAAHLMTSDWLATLDETDLRPDLKDLLITQRGVAGARILETLQQNRRVKYDENLKRFVPGDLQVELASAQGAMAGVSGATGATTNFTGNVLDEAKALAKTANIILDGVVQSHERTPLFPEGLLDPDPGVEGAEPVDIRDAVSNLSSFIQVSQNAQGIYGEQQSVPSTDKQFRASLAEVEIPDNIYQILSADPDFGPAMDSYEEIVIGLESSGDPNAKNPNSSAEGLYQFIDSRFLEVSSNMEWATGLTDKEILEFKTDPTISKEVFRKHTAENVAALTKAVGPPSDDEVYMAHVFGAEGAINILTAPPNALISEFVSPAAVKYNPTLTTKDGKPLTVRQVIRLFEDKFDG